MINSITCGELALLAWLGYISRADFKLIITCNLRAASIIYRVAVKRGKRETLDNFSDDHKRTQIKLLLKLVIGLVKESSETGGTHI